MVKDHPNIPALDIMKEVGRIWQNIGKEDLDHFKEKSRKDMDRYWKEHESFITKINDLRASSRTDKSLQLDKDDQGQSESSLGGIPSFFASNSNLKQNLASTFAKCSHSSDNH